MKNLRLITWHVIYSRVCVCVCVCGDGGEGGGLICTVLRLKSDMLKRLFSVCRLVSEIVEVEE